MLWCVMCVRVCGESLKVCFIMCVGELERGGSYGYGFVLACVWFGSNSSNM